MTPLRRQLEPSSATERLASTKHRRGVASPHVKNSATGCTCDRSANHPHLGASGDETVDGAAHLLGGLAPSRAARVTTLIKMSIWLSQPARVGGKASPHVLDPYQPLIALSGHQGRTSVRRPARASPAFPRPTEERRRSALVPVEAGTRTPTTSAGRGRYGKYDEGAGRSPDAALAERFADARQPLPLVAARDHEPREPPRQPEP